MGKRWREGEIYRIIYLLLIVNNNILLKGVIIKSLQCHMKLKNENGTATPCKLFEGCNMAKCLDDPQLRCTPQTK